MRSDRVARIQAFIAGPRKPALLDEVNALVAQKKYWPASLKRVNSVKVF